MKSNGRSAVFFVLPGFGDILWIAAFMGVIGLGPRMMNVDGDLGRHLTVGRLILESGQVPLWDVFSNTMTGQPLVPHEWLAQVIFALAARWMGLNGVVLVCGVVIATSFWLVYRRARSLSQAVLLAVLCTILAMAASSLHWLTRPHLFTFLLLAAWMLALDALRAGRLRAWVLLPLLMWAWANLHGAFLAGLVTWGLVGVGVLWDGWFRRVALDEHPGRAFWRAYLLGGGSAFLVTLLNPAGFGLWSVSTGFLGSNYLVGHTAEYLPPNFQDPSTWPFLIMIGVLVLVFGVQGRRISAAHVIPAVAWLVMALYSVRNVPLFAIVAAPVLAVAMRDWLAEQSWWRIAAGFSAFDERMARIEFRLRGVIWPLVVFVLCVVVFRAGIPLDFSGQGNRFDPQVFPVQAVDWLQTHPQDGVMFNHFPWGGYLLYRLWPEQRVFIDGQTDFYGEALTRQYEQVLTTSSGWQDVLTRYHVQWALVPADGVLAAALRHQPDWQTAYQDGTAVILIHIP